MDYRIKNLLTEPQRNDKPYYYTKAEIILREDIQDFRQDGMTEDEILKAFIAAIWSLL